MLLLLPLTGAEAAVMIKLINFIPTAAMEELPDATNQVCR